MLVILLTFVVIVLIWWYVNMWKWNKYLGEYGGPIPFPIIGSAYKFGSLIGFLPTAFKLLKKHGSPMKVFLGSSPRLLITDSEHIKRILTSSTHVTKGHEYTFTRNWIGTGLITGTGTVLFTKKWLGFFNCAKWRNHRKIITPTFYIQILEKCIDVFNKQSAILVEKIRNAPEKLDIYPYAARCSLDIICETAMGTCVNAQTDTDSEYVNSVKGMSTIIMERTFNPLKIWDCLYKLTNDYRLEQKYLKVLHGYSNSVIQSKKKALCTSNIETADDEYYGNKNNFALLDALLQARIDGKPLSDENIREEVDTFLLGCYDTTASGLSFTLYCLANNSEVQEKVVSELKGIYRDDPYRDSTIQDLQDMKYLDMVIKETMRLYPPIPYISRQLVEDAKYGDLVLPKDLQMSLLIIGLHRREELYPDPLKFDPERFSTENSIKRPKFHYIPFSAGPRSCIGQRYAVLELKATLSKVLRHFEVLPVHTPIVISQVTLKSANGILVSLKERDISI